MNFHFPLWPHFLWLISSSWIKSSQDKNEYDHFEEKSQTFFFFFFQTGHFTGCGYRYYQSKVRESDSGIIKLLLTAGLCKIH